tara:strand:- start:1086 stop:1427 length:342 start_codon:yes stop_codon:yes gene_type:complete
MKHKYLEERPWGNFEQFTFNEISTIKILNVKPNSRLSYQFHHKRDEFWRVIDGNGFIVLNDKEISVKKGNEFFIPKETKHRIFTKDNSLSIMEISYGEFDENDIVRLEDDYGR